MTVACTTYSYIVFRSFTFRKKRKKKREERIAKKVRRRKLRITWLLHPASSKIHEKNKKMKKKEREREREREKIER